MAIENSREDEGILAIEHTTCLMVDLSTDQQQRCQGVETLICVAKSSFGFDRMVGVGVVKEDWFSAFEQLFVNQVTDLAWPVKK
ncbi:hypothetical protein J4E91_009220 [Alternaria rosae]|nr:hypothetical protein J4E91_009220 [Alternaria rosae]